MGKTIKIATLTASDRGNFVTKKEARQQVRNLIEGAGISLGLFTRTPVIRDGRVIDVFTVSPKGDDNVVFTFERGVGNAVTANCTKAKLTALKVAEAKAKAEAKAEAKASKPAKAKADKPAKAKARKAKAEAPELPTLDDLAAMGADELGEMLTRTPTDGGLSAGSLRAILNAEGVEVPQGRLRKPALAALVVEAIEGLYEDEGEDEGEDEEGVSYTDALEELEEMSMAELREYAKDHGVEGKFRRKDDIIDAIVDAAVEAGVLAAPADYEDEDEDEDEDDNVIAFDRIEDLFGDNF